MRRSTFVKTHADRAVPHMRQSPASVLKHTPRAVGLDTGATRGFDDAEVDAGFIAGTDARSTILTAIGGPFKLFSRSPRISLDQVAKIV